MAWQGNLFAHLCLGSLWGLVLPSTLRVGALEGPARCAEGGGTPELGQGVPGEPAGHGLHGNIKSAKSGKFEKPLCDVINTDAVEGHTLARLDRFCFSRQVFITRFVRCTACLA